MKCTFVIVAIPLSMLILKPAKAAAQCVFTYNTVQCPENSNGVGQACCANQSYVADSGSRAGDQSYVAAFCHVTKGSNSSTWCGTVMVTPTFEQQYGTSCSVGQSYQCQYSDSTLSGNAIYPSVMECVAGKCLMDDAIQATGDPCSNNAECASNLCVNGVCQGVANGQPCFTNGCSPGYFCKITSGVIGVCEATVPDYSSCESLAQCETGSICNLSLPSPICLPLFSMPVGYGPVNTPDLCASAFTAPNKTCINPAMAAHLYQPCDCGSIPSTPGLVCSCTTQGICKTREHTMRTQNMVNARKAARQCFVNAKAPDGTPCADPWTNLGQGRRATDIGTCGYLKCHSQVLAWYAAEGDTESGDNEQFNHNSACAQTVYQAFYTAAANNLIPCSLPNAWRNSGWICGAPSPTPAATSTQNASPTATSLASPTATSIASPTATSLASPTATSIASPTATSTSCSTPTPSTIPVGNDAGGASSAGIACGILIPLALGGGVAFMIKTGKGPRWFHNGVDKCASKFKRRNRGEHLGTSISTVSPAYRALGSVYAQTSAAGYGSNL